MQAQILNAKGEDVGKVELRENIFGLKPSKTFLHEYVTVYRNNQRAYSANTKTRTEVSGGGRKPWKQKHTGRARAGSNRSPLWRHGGIAHGPKAGRVLLSIPRQKARLALAQALAAKQQSGAMIVVDAFTVQEPKTRLVSEALKALKCEGRTVLVLDQPDAKLARASRNIPTVEIMLAGDLNAYAVLRSKRLVVTRPALEKLGARWN